MTRLTYSSRDVEYKFTLTPLVPSLRASPAVIAPLEQLAGVQSVVVDDAGLFLGEDHIDHLRDALLDEALDPKHHRVSGVPETTEKRLNPSQ